MTVDPVALDPHAPAARTGRTEQDRPGLGRPESGQSGSAVPLPGALRIGLTRGRLEVRAFFRERQAVAFVFALPAILLVLLGSIFGHQTAGHGVSVGQLFAAGMIAGGIGATSFQNLGLTIAAERERGTLKRLRGTPMPPAAYFLGKIILVFTCTLAEVAVLAIVGMLFFHLSLPATAGQWWTLAWVFVLGTTACSLTGIALSSLSASATNSFPVITLPFLVLQFISGVYVPFTSVPAWLQQVAALFPLKWLSQGLRSAFLPAGAASLEPAHSWQHGLTALVLAAWIAGGLALCVRTFRWRTSKDG
jgi:ABC-2 type transport system permease protein